MRCSLLVLSTYLDGELDARKGGELEAHLVGCERCQSGLGYLREEVERISALARVHVPDHSVHALFEQLGLLGAADPLPYRVSPTIVPEAEAELPPWLAAKAAGKALPWAPRKGGGQGGAGPRPAADDRAPQGTSAYDQTVLPLNDAGGVFLPADPPMADVPST